MVESSGSLLLGINNITYGLTAQRLCFLCSWSSDLELPHRQCAVHCCPLTVSAPAQNILFSNYALSILCIRDIFAHVLCKSTFYLLTQLILSMDYLTNVGK